MLILRTWQLVLSGVLLTARWWKALKSNGPVCCGEPMQPAYNAQEGMLSLHVALTGCRLLAAHVAVARYWQSLLIISRCDPRSA